MVKLAANGLILLAALGAGLRGRGWYYRRRRVLAGLVCALERMEAELSGSETETEELLNRLGQTGDELSAVFRCCAEELEHLEEEGLAALWQEALERANLPLTAEERETAGRLGYILGRYDGQLQAKLIAGLRAELESHLALAREECGREGKLILTLSCSAGVLAVLMLN